MKNVPRAVDVVHRRFQEKFTNMFQWLKDLLETTHIHQWETTYTYSSMKDMCPTDRSGTIYTGQRCKVCPASRTRVKEYGKNGQIKEDRHVP